MTTLNTLAIETIRKLRDDHERLRYMVENLQREIRLLRGVDDSQVQWATLTDTLHPGSSANAKLRRWYKSQWIDTSGTGIEIYDTHNLVFGISDEIIPVVRNTISGRFETVAQIGLTRFCKPDAEVTAGSNGTVSIYNGTDDTGVNVVAHLTWMHNSTNIAAGCEAHIEYRREQSKWVFINADCP